MNKTIDYSLFIPNIDNSSFARLHSNETDAYHPNSFVDNQENDVVNKDY